MTLFFPYPRRAPQRAVLSCHCRAFRLVDVCFFVPWLSVCCPCLAARADGISPCSLGRLLMGSESALFSALPGCFVSPFSGFDLIAFGPLSWLFRSVAAKLRQSPFLAEARGHQAVLVEN